MKAKSDIQIGLLALPFNAIDKLFLLYNAAVFGLVLIFGAERADLWALVLWHLALTGLVVLLATWQNVSGDAVSRLLRYAYPALLLPFVHYESGVLSQLVTADYFDPVFANLDRWLFGRDLYAWLAPTLGSLVISEIMNGAYFSFYLMITGLLLATYLWRRQWSEELVFMLTLCLYTHYFFFILLPVVGPTGLRASLFAGQGGLVGPFVYALVESGDTAGGAFPSSHCAGVIFLNWYAGRIFGRRVALLLAPVTILVVISSVYLSMHYAVDSVAGLITGGLFAYFGSRIYRRVTGSSSTESAYS